MSNKLNFSERLKRCFSSEKWYIDYLDEDRELNTSGPFKSKDEAEAYVEDQQSNNRYGEKYDVQKIYSK